MNEQISLSMVRAGGWRGIFTEEPSSFQTSFHHNQTAFETDTLQYFISTDFHETYFPL